MIATMLKTMSTVTTNVENTMDAIAKTHPGKMAKAIKALDLSDKYPVKGGTVIVKKEGGWYEGIIKSKTKKPKK